MTAADYSEGTHYLMTHPELWASADDLRAARLDMSLYGTGFSRRGPDGLLRRIDPATVAPFDSMAALGRQSTKAKQEHPGE